MCQKVLIILLKWTYRNKKFSVNPPPSKYFWAGLWVRPWIQKLLLLSIPCLNRVMGQRGCFWKWRTRQTNFWRRIEIFCHWPQNGPPSSSDGFERGVNMDNFLLPPPGPQRVPTGARRAKLKLRFKNIDKTLVEISIRHFCLIKRH